MGEVEDHVYPFPVIEANLQPEQSQAQPSQQTTSQQLTPILSQRTRQILIQYWSPCAELRGRSPSPRHKEQLLLHLPQTFVATDDNSAL
jgi:hypothetical protein